MKNRLLLLIILTCCFGVAGVKADVQPTPGYARIHDDLQAIKDSIEHKGEAAVYNDSLDYCLYEIVDDMHLASDATWDYIAARYPQETSDLILISSLKSQYYSSAGEPFGANYELHTYPLNYDYDNNYNRIERTEEWKRQNSKYRLLYYSKAYIYYQLANYKLAKDHFEVSKELFIAAADTTSVDYVKCLLHLSLAHNMSDDIVMANVYYELAHDIFEQKGYADRAYLSTTFDYVKAMIDMSLERKNEAIAGFRKIIDTYEHENFENKAMLVYAIINIAYITNGKDYDIIEKINEVLSYNNSDSSHPRLTLSQCIDLFQILMEFDCENNTHLATFYSLSLLSKYLARYYYSHFPSSELDSYWSAQSRLLVSISNNLALQAPIPETIDLAFDNALFAKTFLYERKKSLDYLRQSMPPAAQDLYDEYTYLFKQFQNDNKNLALKLIYDRERIVLNYDSLWHENIELTLKSDSIKHVLVGDEVAVEYSLTIDSIATGNKKVNLCAFVTRKGSNTALVKLCDYNELYDVFAAVAECNSDSARRERINDIYTNDSIYIKLWKPLEDTGLIHPNDTVFYSPAGDINKINLAIIRCPNGKRLQEVYTMRQVASAADIVDLKHDEAAAEWKKHEKKSIKLYGGIDYDADHETRRKQATAPQQFSPTPNNKKHSKKSGSSLVIRDVDTRQGILFLDNTQEEVESICETLKGKVEIDSLTGHRATEESFKAVDGNAPSILHIATHGFFIEDKAKRETSSVLSNQKTDTERNEEMIYCGLMFAGANKSWNEPVMSTTLDDGILTAEEISWLDLRGCELVVLSACETALGTIDLTEGVFGLQRAFRYAGAKKVLMSLWKVDDKATAMLMSEFYKNLGKYSCHDALKKAQETMRKSKGSPHDYSDPYYWAGFVLLE